MAPSRLGFAVPLALLLALAAAVPTAGAAAPRLAGATEVDPPGKYPFAAALVDRHTADTWRGRFCDGALVGTRWVLTAARCLEDRRPGDVDVVVGRHDLTTTAGWRVPAAAFHIHPRHDGSTAYDVALVELADAIPATSVIVGFCYYITASFKVYSARCKGFDTISCFYVFLLKCRDKLHFIESGEVNQEGIWLKGYRLISGKYSFRYLFA